MFARCLMLACVLTLTTAIASAEETPSQLSMIGVGSNGFDFMIGTWKCDEDLEQSVTTANRFFIYVKPSHLTDSIVLDWDGPHDQIVESLDYDPSAKTWHSKYTRPTSDDPRSFLNSGGVTDINPAETQSTSDTGSRIVWPGLDYSSSSHKSLRQIRETWTFAAPDQLEDLFEIQQHGSWILWIHAT